jgi:hypothetical protein
MYAWALTNMQTFPRFEKKDPYNTEIKKELPFLATPMHCFLVL